MSSWKLLTFSLKEHISTVAKQRNSKNRINYSISNILLNAELISDPGHFYLYFMVDFFFSKIKMTFKLNHQWTCISIEALAADYYIYQYLIRLMALSNLSIPTALSRCSRSSLTGLRKTLSLSTYN